MSLVCSSEHVSYWANCPTDILLLIFRKLDFKSLFNSMFVNKHWGGVAEYYCEHFDIWEKMVEYGIDNKGLREKSTLGYRDIIQCAQRWYSVKNSGVFCCRHYNFEVIRNICLYKDNLLIVTNKHVKYCALENFILMKNIEITCERYEESSSLSANLSLRKGDMFGYNELTLINKLHNENCHCTYRRVEEKAMVSNISSYKVHSNCCYVIDINNVLWVYKADKCEKWDVRFLAKYYGSRDSISYLHIHQEEVYILLSRGDVLHVDMARKKFEKVFELDMPMYHLDPKPHIFASFSALCAVTPEKEFHIHWRNDDHIVVACPGLTCMTEHGPVLLLGYEDGKIEIFLTSNLFKHLTTPELRFYLPNYTESHLNKITALEVYEDEESHHLFVTTERDFYELLIYET